MRSVSLSAHFSRDACRVWGVENSVCDWVLRLGPLSLSVSR